MTNEEYAENCPVDSTLQNPDNQTTSTADHPKPFTKPVGDKQLTNEQPRSVPSGTRKRNDWALKLYEE